jgi:hypothetical protein
MEDCNIEKLERSYTQWKKRQKVEKYILNVQNAKK